MRVPIGSLLIVVALCLTAPTQSSKPIPPGIRQADKLPGPADDVPPTNPYSVDHSDPKLMREQAQELAGLAQTIPSDVDQFAGGKLPKDMSSKLKRIEKLSKELRGELSR